MTTEVQPTRVIRTSRPSIQEIMQGMDSKKELLFQGLYAYSYSRCSLNSICIAHVLWIGIPAWVLFLDSVLALALALALALSLAFIRLEGQWNSALQ